MTWKELKLATIQKMFSADGATIPSDDSTRDYLAAMPFAANEGILMMATAGKFVVKSVSISINPIPNLLGKYVGGAIHSLVNGTTEYTAEKAKSFYYEVTGKCTVTISIDDEVLITEEIEHIGDYIAYKGLIPNPDNKQVKITFNSEYPFAFKNIALYEAKYDSEEEVPPYAERVRFKMPELVDDFHTINSIYFEGDITNSRYLKTDEVFQESDKIVAFDREIPGNYIVYYNALPPTITSGTPDDYELPLDREVAAILPLYMASQLFKEDDISIATQYRNEFEVAFERLQSAIPDGKAEVLESEGGWI